MSTITLPQTTTVPPLTTPVAGQLPLWQLLATQFGRGAVLGTVIVGGLTGLYAGVGLTPLGDLLVVAALCFLITFAGEGLALLLRAVVFALLRVAKVPGLTRTSGKALAVALGRIAGAGALLYGHVAFPDTFFKYITVSPVGQVLLPVIAITWVLIALARPPQLAPRWRTTLLAVRQRIAVNDRGLAVQPGLRRLPGARPADQRPGRPAA
jgi:hypothetical protein